MTHLDGFNFGRSLAGVAELPDTEEEIDIRTIALQEAVELNKLGDTDPQVVLSAARQFEEFLIGNVEKKETPAQPNEEALAKFRQIAELTNLSVEQVEELQRLGWNFYCHPDFQGMSYNEFRFQRVGPPSREQI